MTTVEEYVDRVVAAAPPLTPEQIDTICAIMYRGEKRPKRVESPDRIKALQELRNAEEALRKARQLMQDEMVGCQGCSLTRQVHGYQKNHGLGYHGFVPMTPDETIHVIELHKPKLAEAERALASAKLKVQPHA